jgi:3-dehydroquinate synthase
MKSLLLKTAHCRSIADEEEDPLKKIDIQGKTGLSQIIIGESLRNLGNYLPEKKAVIITDTNVWSYYHKQFPALPIIQIDTGEKIKTLDTIRSIYEQLMDYELDRDSFLIGIGGGIVCDITGYVASTYLRGLRFGYVATTLLAQVDASVGGKTGVNFKGYKNMIGTFNQPDFVLCDLALLNTLPEEERRCGFAEIIKHGAIADPDLFRYLASNKQMALELNKDIIERLVRDSVRIKARVVNADEKETGERRKLNFGHTFGHALQKITGLPHGEGVSVGMVMAADLSVKKGLLDSHTHERLKNLLIQYQLPTETSVSTQELLKAVRMDKKRQDLNIHFVFLRAVGRAEVKKVSLDEIKGLLDQDKYRNQP